MTDEVVEDVRAKPPLARLAAWRDRVLGPPGTYVLTRTLIFRLLGIVYVFAFLGLILQGPALLGSHGLTPAASYVDMRQAEGMTFWDLPSLFMWGASDGALTAWAYVGLVLSIALALGYANMPSLLALWFIYGSYERVGQLWFGFGWEIQIVETTLIAAFLAHPWDPRPLRARPPSVIGIVLMRWLVFRIMIGSALIKLRGDSCWIDLTCLDFHFETQPIPNPLSPLFHDLPHPVLAGGVLFNFVVELAAPIFVFGPRKLRLVAGLLMASFQVTLIASGNLAFLNWLTLVPVLACFDDAAILRVVPLQRLRAWLASRKAAGPPPRVQQILAGLFAVIVFFKSFAVVDNLFFADRQAMNRDYDAWSTVNTYGAFGSVGDTRYELVIEGTLSADPQAPDAEWRAYELPCKPGDPARRPCVLGPYHRRLDWLIWFAAMNERPSDPWLVHLVWKLLDGDTLIRGQLHDPFGGTPPRWVRIQRYIYKLQPYSAKTWWSRELVDPDWLRPVSRDDPELRAVLARYRWPSPSVHT
jgi:hypothetical protein